MKFLERIRQEKRDELSGKRRDMTLADQRRRAEDTESPRDFAAALDGGAIIAELKARTPSVPGFRHSESLLDVARMYQDNGAAALSVVTDERNFGTSLNTLTAARRAVSLPAVAKEFVIDEYQIFEARSAGADALLLIVRLLEPSQLVDYLGIIGDLDMTALVETHTESDIVKALEANARVVGINNRDLDRMVVDVATTQKLAPLVPQDRLLVSESGIDNRDQIDKLTPLGVDAFLIGGSLLSADDPGAKLRELTKR